MTTSKKLSRKSKDSYGRFGGRFYSKEYTSKFDLMINWISSSNKHKFHYMFHHLHQIIDSRREIPTQIVFDYNGYALERYNEWHKAQAHNIRFFVCHGHNGHFEIVDVKHSDPMQNEWKEYIVPKKDTAIDLCDLLNRLSE